MSQKSHCLFCVGFALDAADALHETLLATMLRRVDGTWNEPARHLLAALELARFAKQRVRAARIDIDSERDRLAEVARQTAPSTCVASLIESGRLTALAALSGDAQLDGAVCSAAATLFASNDALLARVALVNAGARHRKAADQFVAVISRAFNNGATLVAESAFNILTVCINLCFVVAKIFYIPWLDIVGTIYQCKR
jgi:hypothetical protein